MFLKIFFLQKHETVAAVNTQKNYSPAPPTQKVRESHNTITVPFSSRLALMGAYKTVETLY